MELKILIFVVVVAIFQKDISYLYKTAERTRNETDKANKLAKEVHENATNILRTLEKFDELITSGKAKVASAELLKPQIEQNIQFSNNLLADLNGQFNILNGKLADIKSISAKSQMILTEANKVLLRFLTRRTKKNFSEFSSFFVVS